jgi:hypothetical protein
VLVSFLGIHKSEPDICIGFSLALRLQYVVGDHNLTYTPSSCQPTIDKLQE